ncbi:MAG: hypothetical protein IPK26_16365 [Planctomycetes bacterium]|nr:hypothetical protein [Planctomycetota bacterium]
MLAGIRGFRLLPLVLAAIAPTQERQAWQVLRAARIDGAHTVTAAAIRSVGGAEDDFAAFHLGVGHLWLQGPGDRLRDTLFPEIR